MNGEGITPRYSYFEQFKSEDIDDYLDYLRELERVGPAALTQDKRFVSGPEEITPQYPKQGYGIQPQEDFGDIEPVALGIPERPEGREPISRPVEPTQAGLLPEFPETVGEPVLTLGRLGQQAYRGAAQGFADIAEFLKATEEQRDIEEEVRPKSKSDLFGMPIRAGEMPSPKERFYISEWIDRQTIKPSKEEIKLERIKFKERQRTERTDILEEFAEAMPKPLPGTSGLIESAVAGMSRFLPAMGISAINPLAGAGVTFAQLTGMKYAELIEQGIDKDRAYEAAIFSGLGQTPIEMAGNLIQIGALKNIAKSLNVTGKISKKLATFFEAIGKGVLAEGTEEFIQQYFDEAANIYAVNPDSNIEQMFREFKKQFPQITKNAVEAAKVGAVGGGLLAGAGGTIQAPFAAATLVTERPAPPPSPPPYEIERKYTPPVDLVDTVTEEDKKAIKAAIAEARKGTLTVDQLEGIQNILAEKYPPNTKEIQNIEKEITRLREMAPRPGEELEAIEPVEVEEAPLIPEEVVPEEIVPEEVAIPEEVEPNVYQEYMDLTPNSDETMEIEGVEIRKLSEIPVEVPLPEGIEAKAYTDGENIYLKEGLSPDEFVSAIDEEMESIRTGVIPSIEEEYPEVVEEGIAEAEEKVEEKPTASFLSWQETPEGDHIALYNVETGPKEGTTVMVEGLEREGIEIPETPEKPAKVPPMAPPPKKAPVKEVEEIPTIEEIDKAAAETETEPTEAQKEAGTYKKGHIKLYGFDISIENPKGSMRSGVDPTGKEWSIELKHHYGYIRGTKGKDKDHLDVFIGSKPESDKVFVVDQIVPETGKFDEHKIMMGFPTVQQARVGYLANYERGWKGLGNITELTVDDFKEWTKGDTTKAIGEIVEKAPVKEKVEEPTKPTRDEFILERLNIKTDDMEKVVFSRGEEIQIYISNKTTGVGRITGISHAKKEFQVDNLWYGFGRAYKIDYPMKVPPKAKVEKEKPTFISEETRAKARDAETKARQKRLRFAASQKHLVPWIAASGGVWDSGLKGEIDDIIYTQDAKGRKKPRKGLMRGFKSRATGRTLDVVVRDAREAGFDVKNTDHLLELIEKDLAAAEINDIKGRVGKLTTEPTIEKDFIEGLIENGREELRRKGLSDQEIERTLEEGSDTARTTPEDEVEKNAEDLGNWFKEQGEKVPRPTQETLITKEAPFELKPTEAPPEVIGPLGKKAVIPTEKIPVATKGEQVSLLPKEKGEQVTLEEAIEEKEKVEEIEPTKPPTISLEQAKSPQYRKVPKDYKAKKGESLFDIRDSRDRYYGRAVKVGETRLAMAGEKAIGAPKGPLVKAQKMLAKGKDEKAVWKATGWIKGAEGKWKWEIDDSGAKLTYKIKELGIDSFSYTDGIKLQDFLNHPALFSAYPELRTIPIKMELGELNLLAKGLKPGASHSIQGIEIIAKNLEQAFNQVLHEIQHAIQGIEGFAKGGSPEAMAQELVNKEARYLETTNETYKELSEKIDSLLFEGFTIASGAVDMYRRQMQVIFDEHLTKKYGDEHPSLALYKRLAGEIEAREAALRKGLTAEQRRALPPYAFTPIDRADWIIRKGEGTSFSVEPALKAEPRGYEFTKQQQKDVVRVGQMIPTWLQKAGAEPEILDKITVELKPFIDLRGANPALMAKTLADWAKEGGIRVPVAATTIDNLHASVQLAVNGQNLADLERITYHEWYHIAKRWLLPPEANKQLSKHFKTEEGEADAFAEYMRNAKSIKAAPNVIKRLFLKLKRMLTIIANGLKGKAFARPEDIFGQIRVGAYRPRMRGKVGAGIAFELTPELKLALEKRFFKAVAMRLKGTVYEGKAGEIHYDVYEQLPQGMVPSAEHGFIDQQGKFYTREEAAIAVGQIDISSKQLGEARAMAAEGLMPETKLAMKKMTPEEREWADNWIKEQVKPPEQQAAQVPEQKAEFKALPKEADKPPEPSSFESAKEDWFGNKDWSRQVFTVEAKRLQDTIKEILGKKRYDRECQDIDQAIHVYLDLKRNPEHLEEFYDELSDDQKKIVNLATKVPENPGLMHIADYLRTVYDKIGEMALSQNVIFNTLDNYVARAWKIPKKYSTDLLQKFKTTTRHSKHRVFETILEGWAKKDPQGNRIFELEVTGASNNLELLRNEIARTIEDKRLISKLRKTEWRDTGNPVIIHKQLKGYEEIKHPNFTYWVPEARIKHGDTTVYGPKFRIQTNWGAIKGDNKRATKLFDNQDAARTWVKAQKDATEFRIEKRDYLWRREPLYAPEEIAKRLNKILGVSKLKGIGPIDTLTKYNAIFKSTILLTSLFHHQAFIRSYLLGTRHKTLAEWNVFKMYKEGLKAINELGPEIELLVRNGLTLGKMQDWEENILRQEDTVIGKVLDKTRYTKAFKDWANEMRERQAKFLFQNFGAGLKAQAALIEYRNMLKENPDLEPNERARIIADLINDDFGGLHLQRIERNPTTQHIFRLLALAPDWTESNVNTMWKAFRSGEAAKTHLYRRFWASVITKGLTAQVIANILLSFMDDDDYITRFKKAWAAGHFRWLDIDVTPIYKLFGGKSEARKYFGIFGHFRDPMKFIIHPIRSAKHKGSVFFRIFLEALTGVDWKGHRFTSISEILGYDDKGLYVRETEEHKIGEPKGGKLRLKTVTPKVGKKGPIGWRQIPSYMISQLRGVTPVQVQNFIAWIQGEIEGFDAIGRSIGAHVGSTYPTEKKQTKEFVEEWLDIKREAGSFTELQAKVRDYNERQKLRPTEDATPISWSTIAKKGINIRKAEVAAERRKAVNE